MHSEAATIPPETLVRLTPASLATYASRGAWLPYPYLRYISDAVADACDPSLYPNGGRLIINMPPRHGKSELLSKWVPIWFLERNAKNTVILASHGAELAAKYGRAIRNELSMNTLLWTRLREDSKAANRWDTPQGGGMTTGGVGSGITGFGGKLLILDDPYGTTEQAYSPTYDDTLKDWYRQTFRTRAEPGATIIVLHHRWRAGDFTDWLLSQPHDGVPWNHIRLPALAEGGDPLGRARGEALCPARYTAESLKGVEASDPLTFAAMMQQAPKEQGAGSVYGAFDAANMDVAADAFSNSLPLCLAIDFNINPGMHALIGQYDARHDAFRVGYELHAERMSLAGCLDAFMRWITEQGGFKYSGLYIYGDASGNAASITTGETCYDQIAARMRAAGLQYTLCVPAANPPVSSRVAAVNDALRDGTETRRLFVHPRCERLISDFRHMRMNQYGEMDKSKRKLSHSSDALGYWVHWARPVGGRVAMPTGRFSV